MPARRARVPSGPVAKAPFGASGQGWRRVGERGEEVQEFRHALGQFVGGVTVVTTAHGGQVYGMTANAFVSVSLDPPLVLVSVDNRACMHEVLPESRRFGVSILSDQQEDLSQHLAGCTQDGTQIPFVERRGMPLLDGALTHLVCYVTNSHPAGDRTLYVGRVEYLDYRDGAPLVFYTGSYRNLKAQLRDHSFTEAWC